MWRCYKIKNVDRLAFDPKCEELFSFDYCLTCLNQVQIKRGALLIVLVCVYVCLLALCTVVLKKDDIML